jgi:ATP-dependent DNA helicase PIF1
MSLFPGLKTSKIYAVKKGRVPGIYETWEEANEQIKGFSGAKHASFKTREEATEYMETKTIEDLFVPREIPELNSQQRKAFDAIVGGKSIFLTGPGGTGKSFLLQNLYQHYNRHTGKKIAITALTGCAALLLGSHAKTLHSWAGIGLGKGDLDPIIRSIVMNGRKKKNWIKTDCLVIDEVSMMTPQLLELLDTVGRRVRKCREKPFGGLQIVLVGDFYQLPPVSNENNCYAFKSPIWNELIKSTVCLTKI